MLFDIDDLFTLKPIQLLFEESRESFWNLLLDCVCQALVTIMLNMKTPKMRGPIVELLPNPIDETTFQNETATLLEHYLLNVIAIIFISSFSYLNWVAFRIIITIIVRQQRQRRAVADIKLEKIINIHNSSIEYKRNAESARARVNENRSEERMEWEEILRKKRRKKKFVDKSQEKQQQQKEETCLLFISNCCDSCMQFT